jgi:hypothetical protein
MNAAANQDIQRWIRIFTLDGAVKTAKKVLTDLRKGTPDSALDAKSLEWRVEIEEFILRHDPNWNL